MLVPPQVIHVKRLKRKAEVDVDKNGGVLDYLRVDDGRKRHRSDAYIYQRRTQHALDAEDEVGSKSPHDIVPVIHSSKPGDENLLPGKSSTPQKPKPDATAQTEVKPKDGVDELLATPVEARPAPKYSSATEPRRFHYSRPLITPKSLLTAGLSTGKRSRINTPTTVFVERGHKRTRTEDVQMKDADSTSDTAAAEASEPPRKLKRPGSDRRGPAKTVVPVKKEVPPSIDKHWADNMDEITRNMNEFALQVIGENLAKIEERDRKEAAAAAKRESSSSASTPQKFKPKPPAKRYAERHPEVATAQQHPTATPTAAADQDDYETASEDEYVVETYVRVPVSSLGKDVNPEKVGLLVFDNEPDADFFYGEEGDSDDEWPEDDEDENAENYYTADYPDDEVDTDDEYDRMAYCYRTGNASDLEEFDERDEDYVLDSGTNDDDATIPPSARLDLRSPNTFIDRRRI